MTRLGHQIPSFTYPDVGPDDIFDVVPLAAGPEEIPRELDDFFGRCGIDAFTVNSIVNPHVPARVRLLGETLSAVVGTGARS